MIAQPAVGSVEALWRYPVKSMLGETLEAGEVGKAGLRGDRTYALIDRADGKVASAKNPCKWPHLFAFRAALNETSGPGNAASGVRITLPDGQRIESEAPELDATLSEVLQRSVSFRSVAHDRPRAAAAEQYRPDMEGLDFRDTVTDFNLPDGTFFDAAPVHVLTTATLDRLHAAYPGRFEVPRFRPNIVIDAAAEGFVENTWVGKILHIGESLQLRITGPCPRCVMTTLAQSDLPSDPGILRTAAQQNGANVGVYAAVLRGGTIRRGDRVTLG